MPVEALRRSIQTKLDMGVIVPLVAQYIIEVAANSEIANRVA
jgi:hypothetical protein